MAKKKAAAAAASSVTSPLLDLHGSFSRAALRTPLRIAFSSDTLTLDDLNRLLCGNGLCLADSAASRIEEQVFSAYGSSFTVEQLVCLLVPIKRVMTYDELSEAEIALLRTKFGELAGKEGTIWEHARIPMTMCAHAASCTCLCQKKKYVCLLEPTHF